MQVCCALRLTCRGASPAYQPTPASQRPCCSPIGVSRRLDAVKLRPRRSRKAADSIDSDAVGAVQQGSAASGTPASRSEQDKHDDLDAGYGGAEIRFCALRPPQPSPSDRTTLLTAPTGLALAGTTSCSHPIRMQPASPICITHGTTTIQISFLHARRHYSAWRECC